MPRPLSPTRWSWPDTAVADLSVALAGLRRGFVRGAIIAARRLRDVRKQFVIVEVRRLARRVVTRLHAEDAIAILLIERRILLDHGSYLLSGAIDRRICRFLFLLPLVPKRLVTRIEFRLLCFAAVKIGLCSHWFVPFPATNAPHYR